MITVESSSWEFNGGVYVKKISVLGRGTMALGIVQIFAERDYEVTIVVRSIDETNPRGSIAPLAKGLEKLVAKEKITKEKMEKTLDNIVITTDMNDVKDSDLVIEAISEDINVKKDTFKKLDELCKAEAILATNTSSLSITEIANATNRPDKVIGMHFFNPVPLMKLVEVIKGIATSDETKSAINMLAEALGKTPVEVEEAPGFVVNRILIPMINEAVGILADGVATAEDIDEAMKLGANHPIGPLALGDLVGLDVCLAIMDVLYDEYQDSKYRAHPMMRKNGSGQPAW
jgi:3-hydroxybutyryl-CoA dehydrogenase